MRGPLLIFAAVFALVGLAFLIGGIRALKNKRLLGSAATVTLALLLLAISALSVTMSIATQGYRAFTREDVAATVVARPSGRQTFSVSFRYPDGRLKMFDIEGDELYVDARILKWKPFLNFVGIHTAYELDRVSGRYLDIEEELTKERTLYSLGTEKSLDLFELRRRYPVFAPFVDAEYGSATFIQVDQPTTFEVRVSTSGLLIRAVGSTTP